MSAGSRNSSTGAASTPAMTAAHTFSRAPSATLMFWLADLSPASWRRAPSPGARLAAAAAGGRPSSLRRKNSRPGLRRLADARGGNQLEAGLKLGRTSRVSCPFRSFDRREAPAKSLAPGAPRSARGGLRANRHLAAERDLAGARFAQATWFMHASTASIGR
jgi:hypothetical protein